MLGVGVGTVPGLPALLVAAPGLVAAQTPAGKVDAAVQEQILAVLAAASAALALLRGRLVTDEGGRYAIFPARRVYLACHIALQCDLRYGNSQLQ
ncbi:hypothetical protein D3C80_924030 [compost metagenome]